MPLHKSGQLSDPNKFKGVVVSSCQGKLFYVISSNHLEKNWVIEGLINDCQGSSKKSSGTAEYVLIIRFPIDKYVIASGKNCLLVSSIYVKPTIQYLEIFCFILY